MSQVRSFQLTVAGSPVNVATFNTFLQTVMGGMGAVYTESTGEIVCTVPYTDNFQNIYSDLLYYINCAINNDVTSSIVTGSVVVNFP